MNAPLLETMNLRVNFETPRDELTLVEEINFTIRHGEIFALVGESGSGKTTLAHALTKLFLPDSGFEVSGIVNLSGHNVLHGDDQSLCAIRRNRIRYVFQEPAQSFNPIARIKNQFIDAIRIISPMERHRALEKATIELKNVGIEYPDDVLESYPHELSVGTLQRVLIALALAPDPDLIIADEPTSSVDAPLRYQLLDLLDNARKNSRTSVLLITHDLDIAKRYADTIAVLYAGRIVEVAPKEIFFSSPLHPYSQMLHGGIRLQDPTHDPVIVINENPIHPADLPSGCKYHPLCHKAEEECRKQEPPLESIDKERSVRCLYWK